MQAGQQSVESNHQSHLSLDLYLAGGVGRQDIVQQLTEGGADVNAELGQFGRKSRGVYYRSGFADDYHSPLHCAAVA